jgi:hypothetical protein
MERSVRSIGMTLKKLNPEHSAMKPLILKAVLLACAITTLAAQTGSTPLLATPESS